MRWQKSVWFKAIAIAIIISLMPIQGVYAGRGRRGGNDFLDIVISFVGGASKPLSAVLQAQMAGTVGSAAYTNALNSITIRGMWSGIVRAGARLAGADRHTAGLLGAISGGFAGGLYSARMGAQGRVIFNSVVTAIVAFEAGYWAAQAGIPVPGLIGSLAGTLTWGVLSGQGFGSGQLLRSALSAGVADAINLALGAAVGKRSPARAYIGNIGNLVGSLASSIVPQPSGKGGGVGGGGQAFQPSWTNAGIPTGIVEGYRNTDSGSYYNQ